LCDLGDKQIGKNAGVELAGAEQDQVGFLDRFEGFRKGAWGTGREGELLNALAAGGDAGFAVDAAAAFECSDERDVRNRGREDLAPGCENLAADADGFGEVAGNVSESGEEEIAEVVADKAPAGVEAILEQAAEQGFVLAESHHAVANVAGRQDAIFAAQSAGTSAVVGDGDDRSEAGDRMIVADFVATASDEVFEAAQKRGKAGAAAESDDVQTTIELFRFRGAFSHDRLAMLPIRGLYRSRRLRMSRERQIRQAISDGRGSRQS